MNVSIELKHWTSVGDTLVWCSWVNIPSSHEWESEINGLIKDTLVIPAEWLWMNILIYLYQQGRESVGKHQWVDQSITNQLLNIFPGIMNECNHGVQILVIRGLISMFGVRGWISLLDINGLTLLGAQLVDVLHRRFSFGKLLVCVISTQDALGSRLMYIYMAVLFCENMS